MPHQLVTAAVVPLDAEAPSVIDLMPVGHVPTVDGRQFWLRDPDQVIAASGDVSRLCVDYDHQTEWTRFTGGTAPAAGWFRRMFVEDGRLRAEVEWTPAGADAIASREYRFISPTMMIDGEANVVSIVRAALTNDPAISANRALAARNPGANDVTELEAARARADAAEAVVCAARTALSLPAEAGPAEITQAVARLVAAEEGLVTQVQALSGQLAAAQAERETAARDALIATASREGKLPPALAEWARSLPTEQLRAFVAAAPVQATAAKDDPGAGRRPAALLPYQKELARQAGMTEEAFAAARASHEEAGQ